jgi:hypothetical protein
MAETKVTSTEVSGGFIRQLGIVLRDNVDKALGTVVANTWYTIRNTADTADLSVTFTNTQNPFYVDVAITAWGNSDSYRNIQLLVDGATGTVLPSNAAVSFVLNGVAPGLTTFQVTATPGSHTIKVQIQSTSANAIDYRNCVIKVYEVMP